MLPVWARQILKVLCEQSSAKSYHGQWDRI